MGWTRSWLLRGVAVAVFAVLVGAWAVGLAGFGDTAASIEKPPNTVDSTDSSVVADRERPADRVKAKPRRTRAARPSPDATAEASPTAVAGPTDDAPSASDPTSPAHSPDSPSPSEDPSDDPPSSPPSSQPPSSPPTQPGNQCTDLASTIDCALDPITGRP